LIHGILAEGGAQTLINFLFSPSVMFLGSCAILAAYLIWRRFLTQPVAAVVAFFLLSAAYVWLCMSITDSAGRRIALFPDNFPITLMLYSTFGLLWLGMRKATLNDDRMARGEPLIEESADDKVLVWPDLVYTELICMVIGTVAITLWAIYLKAPLEPPADPMDIPNPSKAPWYFLGLQELLVYFDPWIAGVLLPGLIIVGLIAIPYIDKNPRGNGYYTFKQRPLAITLFLFGFIPMWVMLIVLGTFLRGPNWNFFPPGQPWDAHKSVALSNINVSQIFWIKMLGMGLPQEGKFGLPAHVWRELPGIVLLLIYFFVLPVMLAKTIFRKLYIQMGVARYIVFMVLFMWTVLVPIKMFFRWTMNLKYIVAITEWFFNV
jgi:hypothetical protein